MAKKIRILQLIISDDPGILDLTREISQAFSKAPYEITNAFLHQTKHLADYDKALSFHFKKTDLNGLRLKALWQLYRYCRQEKFDVVITHRFKLLHIMLTLNRFLNIPTCISVIHGFDEFKRGYRRRSIALGWSKHWHFVAVSEPVSAYLKRVLKLEAADISIIHNAIDAQQLTSSLKTKSQSKRVLNLNEDAFVFGTIGRLVPLKGHLVLIKAFQMTLDKHPNSQLVIIGEGRERPVLEQYIADHGLTQSVKLSGHIDDAASLLKSIDVFILPSLKEGFGLVLLEAMAAKIPIIASNTGGIPYVLGKLGRLIAPIDEPKAYATAMLQHLSGDKEIAQNSERLNKRLYDKFDIHHFQKSWQQLVTEKSTNTNR